MLLLRSDREWRLPRVRLPEDVWAAEADRLVPAFAERLGTAPFLVRQLGFAAEPTVELALREEWAVPRHGRWAGLDDLDRLRLRDDERQTVSQYLRDDGPGAARRPPWTRPGWEAAAREWIGAEAARLGHMVHSVEQVKQWSISSVLRVRTDGPDLYFKVPARLPLFVEEGVVTAALAARFPRDVPAPLAVEPEQGWLLLAAFDPVGWGAPLEERVEALQRFAQLQRSAGAHVDDLLAAGCLDRRLDILEGQLDALFADADAVARLERAEVRELRRNAPAFRDACRRLAELGPPPTLVHGDLHMGNVARRDGELIFFDWTDACIAHPFFDLHSLQWEKDETVRSALLDAYFAEWDGIATPVRLREAAALAAVVIPLHHAVSYATIVAAVEPAAKGELDLTHELLREALARLRDTSAG